MGERRKKGRRTVGIARGKGRKGREGQVGRKVSLDDQREEEEERGQRREKETNMASLIPI